MKHVVMVGVPGRSGRRGRSRSDIQGQAGRDGHTAPKVQPATAPRPPAPAGEVALGSVHFAKGVKADGKALRGRHLSGAPDPQAANPPAKGQSEGLERWVEFTQGGQVKGREVVTIIPQSEIAQVQKDTPPASERARKSSCSRAAISCASGSGKAAITTCCTCRRRSWTFRG